MTAPEVEFVNRELAESEAARAIGLLNQSDESKVEAWFAMQAAADQVGAASNLGVRGLAWVPNRTGSRGCYVMQLSCVDGHMQHKTGAPGTLKEAREARYLDKALALMARKVAELGGLARPDQRAAGTSAALMEAVQATEAGRLWLEGRKAAVTSLMQMVKVADLYGPDGVNPAASIEAHSVLLPFEDRAALVREFTTGPAARAKAMSLRHSIDVLSVVPRTNREPTDHQAIRLALRTGVGKREARSILRALLNGQSKAKMKRAVDEAARMVEEMDRMQPDCEAIAA